NLPNGRYGSARCQIIFLRRTGVGTQLDTAANSGSAKLPLCPDIHRQRARRCWRQDGTGKNIASLVLAEVWAAWQRPPYHGGSACVLGAVHPARQIEFQSA